MAAPAAQPVRVSAQASNTAVAQQPSSCPGATAGSKATAPTMGHWPMMPWPFVMPPWMPMFGMLPGKTGTMMPQMSMPMPLPGMAPGKLLAPSTAAPAPAKEAASAPAAAATASKSSISAAKPATTAAAAADEDDEELNLQPDEEVTVEPDELEVFEKVAAMEREQQQRRSQEQQREKVVQQFERASSPSGSCITTINASNSSAPCSPVSSLQPLPPMQPMPFPPGMGCFPFPGFPCMPMPPMPGCFPAPAQGMPQQQTLSMQPQHTQQQGQAPSAQQQWQKQAQQLWKPQAKQQQGGSADADAAPVPWTSFAADDCGDDLDKDLQELIMLPEDCMQAPAACADLPAPAPGPAAAAKARSSSGLKRISSTASNVSTAEALDGVLGQSPCGSKAKRVLRIRKGSGNGGNSNAGVSTGASSGRIVLKGSTKRQGSTQQQQQGAGSLGVSKGGVQKKVTINASKPAVISNSSKKASTSAPAAAPKTGEQQQPVVKSMQLDDEPSLSLLGDLDSSLSGGDALTAGVMPADDYWDSFMQEASDGDGWDSLLGANELDFVTAGL